MSGSIKSLVDRMSDSDNGLIVGELKSQVIKWIDRSKVKEFQDVGLMTGGMSRQMCVGEHYDENKKRVKISSLSSQKSFSGLELSQVQSESDFIVHTIEELGAMIGSEINHNCGTCPYVNAVLQTSQSVSNDSTTVRATYSCNSGPGSMCPDQINGYYHPGGDHWMGAQRYSNEYEGHFNSYNPYIPKPNDRHATDFSIRLELGNMKPYVKPKETVKDADIAVELLKLDERYGMF